MNLPGSLFKRLVILLALFVAFACVASADTVYIVSGTFATSTTYTGPLDGGTFSGTFTATLPITSGARSSAEEISTFDINLINSSGQTLETLSNTISGDGAVVGVESACETGLSTTQPCDLFAFAHGEAYGLALGTSPGFTSGSVYTLTDYLDGLGPPSSAFIGNETDSTLSLVAFGTIEPATGTAPTTTPEPGTFAFMLLGVGLLAGLWAERKRLFA